MSGRLEPHHAEEDDAASQSGQAAQRTPSPNPEIIDNKQNPLHCAPSLPTAFDASTHALLLLSDSALPLGSFAFSSGLESYLAHQPRQPPASIPHFLSLSLHSLAATSLPYVLTAHRHPALLPSLDTHLDASTPCAVARRASIAQGRALLSVWERAFRPTFCCGSAEADGALASFSALLKTHAPDRDAEHDPARPNAHFAPLWGVVGRAVRLALRDTASVFLLNHAKAVLGAAVRAGVVGPYQAQAWLAGGELRAWIDGCVLREWDTAVEDAGQVAPVLDLWVGRHELLYSRIFNS